MDNAKITCWMCLLLGMNLIFIEKLCLLAKRPGLKWNVLAWLILRVVRDNFLAIGTLAPHIQLQSPYRGGLLTKSLERNSIKIIYLASLLKVVSAATNKECGFLTSLLRLNLFWLIWKALWRPMYWVSDIEKKLAPNSATSTMPNLQSTERLRRIIV